jgi:hypothetical protein
VAFLEPAHHPNPFQMIEAIDFKGAGPNVPGSGDEENLAQSDNTNAQMAVSGPEPDVEPEADARGKVARKAAPVARALPAAPVQPAGKPNFFQRLFGPRPAQPPPAAQPVRRATPPPRR